MKTLTHYISEDFSLKKKGKIHLRKYDPEHIVNDIIHYLEIDTLVSKNNPYNHQFIKTEVLDEIKDKLVKFFDDNDFGDLDPEKFIYTTNDNGISNMQNLEISDRFNYNSVHLGQLMVDMRKNGKTLIYGDPFLALKVEASEECRVVGLGGPYHGYKSCEF